MIFLYLDRKNSDSATSELFQAGLPTMRICVSCWFRCIVLWFVAFHALAGTITDIVQDAVLDLPLEMINIHGEVETKHFVLRYHENLLTELNSFCANNGLGNYNLVHFGLLERSIDILRKKYDVSIVFSILSVEGQTIQVFVQPAIDLVDSILTTCREFGRDKEFCEDISYSTLQEVWPLIEINIAKKHHELYGASAGQLIRNEDVLFLVTPPPNYPTGMGHIFKGLITSMSIHRNSKVANIPGYILGNYSSILTEDHIFSEAMRSTYDRIEPFNTWRWLIPVDEQYHFEDPRYAITDVKIKHELLDNPELVGYFTPNRSIDFFYRSNDIPIVVKKRILKAVHAVKFQPHIWKQVWDITDSLVHPSLGVTVRSWSAAHENKTYIGRKYNESAYKSLITTAVLQHDIKSILIAYDNNELLSPAFSDFLASFGLLVLTFEDWHRNSNRTTTTALDPLEKAAIEMLSLSGTNYVIGDKFSSFLELVFWFGGCKQMVLHLY